MDSIELRHILHQNPEISFREFETQKILLSALKDLKDERLKIYKIAGTGVIALYEPKKGEPFILYRSDIDGLPIEEETKWEFASKNSNMHACGHDVHMSIAYELIKKILSSNIEKNFVFIFQPGEETGAGARYVLDEIEELDIKLALALHITDEYDFKTVATTKGVLFASATEIDLTFSGKASHVAFYKSGIDSIYLASKFLTEFYNLTFDKAIARFGKIEGGNARNIVSPQTTLMGSIRSESLKITEDIINKIQEVAKSVVQKDGGEFSISKGSIYPPVIVNDKLYELFREFAQKNNIQFIDCGMKYTGEDFGYFSQEYPSLMFWAGVSKGEKYGLHNPKFLPNDEVIPYYADVVFNFLKELEI